ncbi:hypothetical protein KEM48_014530 [Puccinia striiformis f. sp. tritici PST-130]|nr:hypothetical protein KEM48_014530 [Puccinia striiformis f. sp. tritici PST-130]
METLAARPRQSSTAGISSPTLNHLESSRKINLLSRPNKEAALEKSNKKSLFERFKPLLERLKLLLRKLSPKSFSTKIHPVQKSTPNKDLPLKESRRKSNPGKPVRSVIFDLNPTEIPPPSTELTSPHIEIPSSPTQAR